MYKKLKRISKLTKAYKSIKRNRKKIVTTLGLVSKGINLAGSVKNR